MWWLHGGASKTASGSRSAGLSWGRGVAPPSSRRRLEVGGGGGRPSTRGGRLKRPIEAPRLEVRRDLEVLRPRGASRGRNPPLRVRQGRLSWPLGLELGRFAGRVIFQVLELA
ncbi:hypothetical protein Salat_1210200 [Sesamum alatum]|uniref:Uncharacterized protein n=1 Tax=Sesamum alatum TaxID=300844 RepID=A0AAE1YF17_9LAMI|nr:hypothetical protein Salat_1210200 [Sesamum alatum]